MFTSNTKEDLAQMLAEIGVKSFDELLPVPQVLLKGNIDLPSALNEQELTAEIKKVAAKNKPLINFAGGGMQEHFVPAAVNALSTRGEFLTAYTPYQAEASQGTLQAIYEYQSCICALFDMDISNASHYDGATALAEACLAATHLKNNKTILYTKALQPNYTEILKTYFKNAEVKLKEVPLNADGTTDLKQLETLLKNGAAAFILQTPNYFGCLESAEEISSLVHTNNALLIANVNPTSLGILQTPGSYDADFAVAEGQGLGNALNYGGPTLGIFTCKKQFVRNISGRLCGMAKDKDGKRAFVLTLQAREQHIRRERASSNICSNQALCALNATIYLTLLGPEGLKEVALKNLENAHYLQTELCKCDGFALKYKSPFYNEFVVTTKVPAAKLIKAAAKKGFLAGIALAKNELLLCSTEVNTKAQIDALVNILKEVK